MSSNDKRVRELITEQAAEWFVANREGLAPKERQVFAEWLRSSPVHVEEYLAHSVIARDLRKACEYSEEALGELLARARTHPDVAAATSWARFKAGAARARVPGWRLATVMAGTCAALGMGWFALRNLGPMAPAAPAEAIVEIHVTTHHGEQQSRRLADNSILHVNTDSAVTIRYGRQERLVVINAGEADFEVAHDASRPFRVIAGTAQVVDLGTQFDVLLGHSATVVTVVEGRVAVSPAKPQGREQPLGPAGAWQEVSVGADQQVTVAADSWPPTQPIAVDAQRTTAWLHRQVAFDHTPLDKVAAEFNRYAPKPIKIVTPGLQKLEISGVFTTDDPAAFIAFLRSLENVRVEETATQIRVSRDPG